MRTPMVRSTFCVWVRAGDSKNAPARGARGGNGRPPGGPILLSSPARDVRARIRIPAGAFGLHAHVKASSGLRLLYVTDNRSGVQIVRGRACAFATAPRAVPGLRMRGCAVSALHRWSHWHLAPHMTPEYGHGLPPPWAGNDMNATTMSLSRHQCHIHVVAERPGVQGWSPFL